MDNLLHEPRPAGITVIAILGAIMGFFLLIASIPLFFGAGLLGINVGPELREYAIWYGLAGIIIALLQLFVAWGLWTLKPWALWTTIVIEALAIIELLITWIGGYTTFPSLLLNLIIPVIILVYLLASQSVRAAFHIS